MKTQDEYELVFSGDDKGLVSATDRVTKSLGRLTESDNKVKRHLLGFAQDLTTANSATNVLAAGVSRLSEVFKVGLAGGLIAGAIGQIYESGQKSTQVVDALADSFTELQKNAGTSDYAKPIERLRKEAEEAAKAAKEAGRIADEIGGGDINKHLALGAAAHVAEVVTMGRYQNPYRGVADEARKQQRTAEDRQGALNAEIDRRGQLTEDDLNLKLQEAQGPASMQKSIGLRVERLKIAKEELQLAQSSLVYDKTDIQQKRIAYALSEQSLKALNAEDGLQSAVLKIEEKKLQIKLSAESSTEKQYKLAKETAQIAAEEAKAMAVKNSDQASFLKLKAQEAAAVPAQIDEGMNKGLSQAQVRARLRAQDRERRETEKFRERRAADDGLIGVKRDASGRVIEGLDPVTGEKVTKRRSLLDEDRKWDKIFGDKKKDAEKDGAGAGAAMEAKRKAGEADKKAVADNAANKDKEIKGELEKANKHLEKLDTTIKGLVAKR